MKNIVPYLMFCLICCNGQDKNNGVKTNKMEKPQDLITLTTVQDYITKQSNIETEENEPENPYVLSKNDYNISKSLIAVGLKNNGFKFLSQSEFNKKLTEIFKLTDIKNCNNIKLIDNHYTLFGYAMDGSVNTLLNNQYELFSSTHNLFLNNDDKFLSQMFLVKDLVKVENKNYKVTIPQFLIARNKYLFNDSKGDLAWLLANDKEFLKILVMRFGYDKETQINKMVLEDLYREYSSANHNISEKLGEIFFVKDCEGNLKIRKGLLEFVASNTTKDDDRFIYALGNYLDYLFKEDKDKIFDEQPSSKFSLDEKAKIVAYVANIESPAFYKFKPMNSNKAWHNVGTALYNITSAHPEILKIIEKSNYYGLISLKEIIESTQFEEEGQN